MVQKMPKRVVAHNQAAVRQLLEQSSQREVGFLGDPRQNPIPLPRHKIRPAAAHFQRRRTADGPVALRNAILKHPEQFVRTLTEKMLTYGLGRGLEYYDMPTVRGIARDASRTDYKFSSIVLGIVKSAPFQMRRVQDAPVRASADLNKTDPR